MCIITLIVLNRNRKEIKYMENDLVDFFAKQYEIEAAKAQEKAQAEAEAYETPDAVAPQTPTPQ